MKKKNFILVIFALSIFLFVSFQTTDFQSDTKSISNITENPNILFTNIPFQFKTQFENIISKMDFLKSEPELLELFKMAYPNVTFVSQYDVKNKDWKIDISTNGKTTTLYWADSKFLPLEELPNKDLYSAFLYDYPSEVPDPKNFTEEDIKHIREFTDPENRTESLGTSPFLYNLIYDVETRTKTEAHITSHRFLGKRTNVHRFICEKLDLVQADIYEAAKTDSEVQSFLDKLDSADSYAWRSISDSGNRSFHSMGLALDVLPKGWGQKNLYWAWRRDIDPKNWMLLDLDRRWMPPKKVIEIFEKHGFIWGGKWIIWDNMHFEYRPEVILYNKIEEN